MRYDTILFDADGTLFDFLRCEDSAIRETFVDFDIEPSDALVESYSEINDSLWKMLERGEIEKSVLLYHRFELFFEKHGFSCDAKAMAKRYMKALSEQAYFLDGAKELCMSLYGKARMYIVTNGVEFTQKNRYKKSGLSEYFEDMFISGEIGYEKPSVKYFDAVSERIPDFSKERSIIIGDSLSSDIRGGINYGIDTCWYNPSGKPAPDDMNITYIAKSFDEIYDFITDNGENVDE